MTDLIDRYEVELRLAAERHYRYGSPSRWAALRRRPWALLAAAAVVATPALAATRPWDPLLGSTPASRPSVADTAPPAAQLAVLGVLRRAQTDADRSASTTAALAELTPGVRGVRVAAVRALGGVPPATLVPVEQYDDRPAGSVAAAPQDGLCLVVPDGDDGAGFTCTGTDGLLAGRAMLAVGPHVTLLVPDGVAQVDAQFVGGGPAITVPVRDNTAVFAAPAGRPGSAIAFRQTWLAPDGSVVRRVGPPTGTLPAAGSSVARGPAVCAPGAQPADCAALRAGRVPSP